MTVGVKYTKQMDNGSLKRVSESYLVSAQTFTDAEARIHEELGQIIRGEFIVTRIKHENIHDIVSFDDSDIWCKCIVKYDNLDSETELSKTITQNFLVTASSVKEATERISDHLKGFLHDFEIVMTKKTRIIEVMP